MKKTALLLSAIMLVTAMTSVSGADDGNDTPLSCFFGAGNYVLGGGEGTADDPVMVYMTRWNNGSVTNDGTAFVSRPVPGDHIKAAGGGATAALKIPRRHYVINKEAIVACADLMGGALVGAVNAWSISTISHLVPNSNGQAYIMWVAP